MPTLSIIIPTLEEAHFLPMLLSDLRRQSAMALEVIVVDASSHDATAFIARSYAIETQVLVHEVTRRNVAFQRNFGANVATGEILAFLDADARIDERFVE